MFTDLSVPHARRRVPASPVYSLGTFARTCAIVLFGLAPTSGFTQTTTVIPQESNEVISNPGIGFADFQLWSKPAAGLYPKTRVVYVRWYWSELEPVQGQYNFVLVDNTIASAKARNQDFAFRIMPDLPGWLVAKGVQQVGSTNNWIPNHNDALFLQYHQQLVAAFGARYNGSASIDHVDIGSVGCWGEWNSSCCPAGETAKCEAYMPTEPNRRAIVDWYVQSFPTRPLVALASGTGYANTRGAGWRGDCYGDYGSFSPNWNHMTGMYPGIVASPEVANAWQTAPVQSEPCFDMQEWYDRGFSIDLILQKGLDWHMSVFNGKNAAVPSAWRPQVDEWLKKLGYRFVLSELTHTTTAVVGGQMQISGSWINKGVAPAYHPWPLAFRLRDQYNGIAAKWISTASPRTWLPGQHSSADSFLIPIGALSGSYSLDVAVLSEDASRGYVELANTGKRSDLWFPVSAVSISGSQSSPFLVPGARTGIASFVAEDVTTAGNWKGVYGSEGVNLAGDVTKYPSYVDVTGEHPVSMWAATSADIRALQKVLIPGERVAAGWYSASAVTFELSFNDTASHRFSMYMVDWSRYNRMQKVEIFDRNNVVLDSRTISSFNEGKYVSWDLSGYVTVRVTPLSGNALVSGMFFGGAIPTSTAQFVAQDAVTSGSWKGVYGYQGASVAGDVANYPSSVNVTGANPVSVWESNATDARALQKVMVAGQRIAAAWYSPTSVSFELSFNDAAPHRFSMYILDWPRWNRTQKVEILDSKNVVLDSRIVSSFNNGKYLTWDVRGQVKVRVTPISGNALVSGLFF